MTTRNQAKSLKAVPRTIGREEHAFQGHLDTLPAEQEDADRDAPSTPDEILATAGVSTILAMCMLQATLPRRTIARIEAPESLAMVVGVPGSDWIGPVTTALSSFRGWSEVMKRGGGASRTTDKASVGNDVVAGALSSGRSVLGVTTSPERYLPAALVAAADLRIDLGPPTAKAIRATIGLATGRRVGRLPDDVVLGLSLDEMASCIRKGSTPRDCVRRLQAASASKRAGASDLADVPFLEDTSGYSGGAMEHGLALIDAVKAHRRGERSFSSIERKHIILSGNPGTGKTTYARSLAKSLGVHLSVTSVSSWFSQTGGYLNDICKKIDDVFQEASQLGGVLLFDEIDCLPNRDTCDSKHRDYWNAVTAHVLTLLDGAVSSPASRLIIIGATNYPGRLDPALTRPGRLDRLVHIKLPDEVAIEGILRQHLAGDLAGHDLKPMAAIGVGATGAEIAGWAAGARMAARAEGRAMVPADLLGQIAPRETRTPEQLLATARHESSHAACTTQLLIGTVTNVSLVARGAFAARTSAKLRDATMMDAAELDALVVSVLAGRAADEHWGRITSGSAGGPGSDLAHATALVAGKHCTWGLGQTLLYRGDQVEALFLVKADPAFRKTVEADLDRLYGIARDFVRWNEALIDRLARHLVEKRVLSGDEVRRIIGSPASDTPAEGAVATVGGPHE